MGPKKNTSNASEPISGLTRSDLDEMTSRAVKAATDMLSSQLTF